jgi:hypothetical protein
MYDILFVLLTLLYVAVARKLDEWAALCALGFQSETPQGFTDLPLLYVAVRSAIFMCAMFSAIGASSIPWQIGLAILACAWIGAEWLGRRQAFDNIRRLCRDAEVENETPEEHAQRVAWSRKTDAELSEMIRTRRPGTPK